MENTVPKDTTKIFELLANALAQDVRVSLDGEKLIVKLPKDKKFDKSLLTSLKENKEAIIAFLKKEKATIQETNTEEHKIVAFDRKHTPKPPLSFSQERIWFVDQLEGSLQYHMPAVLNLKGDLDKDILAFAFRTIINRHEILRTVYLEDEQGNVFQRILPKDHFVDNGNLEFLELDENIEEQELTILISNIIEQRFDLRKDPGIRLKLLKRGTADYILVIVFHHIATDGWSSSVFVNELAELYASKEEARDFILPNLEIQYADYALWQKSFFTAKQFEQKLNYWREKLAGLETLDLPTDFPRPSIQSSNGAVYNAKIEESLSAALATLAKQQGLTLFMVLLAGFKVLLYRYTYQVDITVGTPTANRGQKSLENLIGFFINNLVLRDDLSGNPSFEDFLKRVKQTALEAYDHQEVPFDQIVNELQLSRDASRSPLFQIMFVLQNTPEIPRLEFGSVVLTTYPIERKTAQFDLTLSLLENRGAIYITAEYCSDLFLPETIATMMEHYQQILVSATANPKTKINALKLLSEKEEQQLLFEFNATQVDFPTDKTAVDLFARQAIKTPDHLALVFGNETMSYQELDQRSNQLAHYLRKQGAREEDRVAVCIPRSIEMIVAVMGILKSGAAYVPIDADYPQERIQYITKDCQASIVVADSSVVDMFSTKEDLNVVLIDQDWSVIQKESRESPSTDLDANNLAYMIYTSGSMGKPKGVMIEHQSMVNLVLDHIELFGIRAEDRISQFVSLSFDASIPEIFMSLFTGASLVILSKETIADQDVFLDFIKEEGISVCSIPPAYLTSLEGKKMSSLRVIMTGGETANVAKVVDCARFCDIYNLYGPTESTVCVAAYKVSLDDASKSQIPIGKPRSNTQIYILDENLQLVPPNVPGEIYVGGSALARAYFNREELTREKFIDNPFASGTRLYKTGDKAKWQKDGNIVFLGRADNQVKVRGYRIELGEIEASLESSPKVDKAIVLTQQEDAGTLYLVAYILPEETFDKEAIYTHLRAQLPEYMIPATLVEINEIPLTPNGKVDKTKLPKASISASLTNEYQEASNEIEAQLVLIWQDILNLEKIGVQDNFFELGGHSLLATRTVSSIRKQMKVEISIKSFFANPKIALLAKFITQEATQLVFNEIQAEERPLKIPLSFSQERLWFLDKLGTTVHYHMPSVQSLKGKIDLACLDYAFKAIVNRHEVLRTVYREEDGKAYQHILPKDQWKLDYEADRLLANEAELAQVVDAEINKPFDLANDHMLRAKLIKRSEQEHVLIIVIHHIASDGWSNGIFFEELLEFYKAKKLNRSAKVKVLKLQYADYAIWQRKYLEGDVLDQKLSYWEDKLKDLEVLNLPTDFIRPAIQSTKGKHFFLQLEKDLCQALEAMAQREGVTLFMLLLSAFKVLLYKYTGQNNIAVGSPTANRTQIAIEELIGFFVNTLTLSSSITGQLQFLDLLQQVKSTTLEAYDHQDVPFEKIVDRVEKERDMSRSSLFQVMFSLERGQSISTVDFSLTEEELDQQRKMDEEATLEKEDFSYDTAKFDLSFDIIETEERLITVIEYCTDLFLPSTIERMAGHFERLLKAIISNPGGKIASYSLLSKAEEKQLLVSFNDTTHAHPKDQSFINLFEKAAIKFPENIAVVFKEEGISYKALKARVNQLANYLRDKELREEALIGICLDRSIEMIVSVLAVFKLGAAYIPIDPNLPQERIDYVLEDSGTELILSTTNHQKLFSAAHQNEIDFVWLDQAAVMIDEESTDALSVNIKANQLAYVIYTSGSTGKPKAVLIEHGSMLNMAYCWQQDYKLDDSTRLLQMASFSFDVFVGDLCRTLLFGGRMVICPEEDRLDVLALYDLMSMHEINILELTPALAIPLMDHIYENQLSFSWMKLLILGSDICPVADFLKLHHRFGDQIRLLNSYGTTETTIDSAYFELEQVAQIEHLANVPIGKPLHNTSIYIVDEFLQLVPIGVTGEILIGGAGLARAYLNNPALNEKKFIPHPFIAEERVYKTGDLGKYLADGNIAFLGRNDDQVKIRGYRIELEEIEKVLQACALVDKCVVIARTTNTQNKAIFAYIKTKEKTFPKTEIDKYLRAQLPSYMVPAFLIEMESIPLSANGKVDRKALPIPDVLDLQSENYLAPRNEIEHQLANVWQDLLQLDRVGVHDNFFQLGGDSIITIQVVSRVKRLGYQLSARNIFELQTIAALSSIMEEQEHRIIAEQGVLEGDAALLPIQEYYFEQEYDGSSHYNQAILIPVDKTIQESLLEEVLEALVMHHDALRFCYREEAGQWYQRYSDYVPSFFVESLEEVYLSSFKHTKAAIAKVCQQYHTRLNIRRGELLKLVLIKTNAAVEQNYLFFVIHHLAVDGVSWRIIVDHFTTAVEALSKGNKIDFGAKTSSVRDWANFLKKHATSQVVEAQLPYWESVTKDFQALPVDHVIEKRLTKDRKELSVNLGKTWTESLLREVHHAYNTEIDDLLLSALVLTVCTWSGKEKLLIGIEGHGRENLSDTIDTSSTVGWFTNLYPVGLNLESNLSSSDLIKSIKEQLRLVPDKGIAYGLLRYLHPDSEIRERLSSGKWNMIFNYLGQFEDGSTVEDQQTKIEISSMDMVSPSAPMVNKLELNASIVEGDLQMNWSFVDKEYEEATIQKLSKDYAQHLQALIEHCREQKETERTAFDYGLSPWVNYKELDEFLAGEENGIKRRDKIVSICRLSSVQEGMLFHHLFDADSKAYNEQYIFDFPKGMQVDVFKACWEKVIEKHSILRTAIYHDALSIPVQCVMKEVELPFEVQDLSSLPKTEQDQIIDEFLQKDLQQGLVFNQAPILRINLFQLDENAYKLVWTCHHIILDGWSMPIILKELLYAYGALIKGESISLGKEERYEDFIKFIQSKDRFEEENFWRDYLKGIEATSLLPFVSNNLDRNKGIGRPGNVHLIFEEDQLNKIKNLVQNQRLTINTLLEGIWAFLLSQYTASKDVVFGLTVSGRPTELEDAAEKVGLYINTIPLRITYQEEQSFSDFLLDIQQAQLAVMEYQHSGLSDIQNWSKVQGDLFDSILVVENYPVGELMTTAWALETGEIKIEEQTNYLLTLNVEITNRLSIGFSYNSALLKEEHVEMMKTHFASVLNQIIQANEEASSLKMKNLSLLSAEERAIILGEQATVKGEWFNKGAIDLGNDLPINLRFEECAIHYKDELAVLHAETSYTYKELNEEANQFAHCLEALQVEAGDFVGVYLERNPVLVSCLLGIIKRGAVYLPLDTQNPRERIENMIANGALKLVITTSELAQNLNQISTDGLLLIDECPIEFKENWLREKGKVIQDITFVSQCSKENFPNQNDLRSWAYMLYTSGSTGQPKAAITRHDGAMNHILAEYEAMELADGFWFLQSAGIGSDISMWQILGPLLKGGATVIIDKFDLLDYAYVIQLLEQQKIDLVEFVPSYAWGMLDYIKKLDQVPSLTFLKWLMFSGEEAAVSLVNEWKQYYPELRLLNGYGPCEASDDISQYEVVEKLTSEIARVPIGRPIANMNIVILDEAGQLCPIGVAGELCVSGVGVGAGYWGMPERTAMSFVANPFKEILGDTMYKTGDLARWLPDGNLDFLGRIDRQVKIRGHRIELGEIESILRNEVMVKDAHLLVYDFSTQDSTSREDALVAFITIEGEQLSAETVEEEVTEKIEHILAELCQEALPTHMQPSYYCFIEEMPLNLSDKVDEKQLRLLFSAQEQKEKVNLNTNKKFVAPSSEAEKTLAQIWYKILGIENISIHDDFFDLGGHSLLATRMVSAIRKKFSKEIAVREVFTKPSIASLAKFLEAENESIPLPEIRSIERPERIPLSFAQERLWFIDQLEGSVQYHMPYIHRFYGDLDHALLSDAFNAVINRHEVLRTIFAEENGKAYQKILAKNQWRLNYEEKIGIGAKEQELLIKQLLIQAFDLSKDYPIRASLLKIAADEYLLVLVIHHIASDGWSDPIFFGELVECYDAKQSGRKAQLREIPIQYADYAIWQRKYLDGDVLHQKLEYWAQKLQGVEVLDLVTDFPRPAVQSINGATETIYLEEAYLKNLEALAEREGVTLFMLLLAVFKLLLHKYTGQDDICIGSPIANRTQIEIEQLIGFFVNSLALRTDLSGNPSFQEFLAQVKNTTLEAYTHQDVPFEKIVDRVVEQRDQSRSPLFQVMFSYESDAKVSTVEFSKDKTTEPTEPTEAVHSKTENHSTGTSMFDLSFNIGLRGSSIELSIEYCRDLFLPSSIQQMAIHFENLLSEVLEKPKELIGNLSMLSAEEEQRLLVAFNDTYVDFPKEKSLSDLFEEMVRRQPEALALSLKEEYLTYEALDQRSNQLAHYLMQEGVVEGELVGICIDRSIEMIVAVLGILKSGALYLPIDPVYPKERIDYLLSDSNAKYVVSTKQQAALFENEEGRKLIQLEDIHDELSILSTESPSNNVGGEALAYMIYTSGSTGKPKAVRIKNNSAVNVILDHIRRFEITKEDKVLQFTSLSFDVSVCEIFMGLLAGAELVLIDKDTINESSQYLSYLKEKSVTVAGIPPAYLGVFDLDKLSFLRVIMTGGDVANVERAVQCAQHSKFFNVYGPTECAIAASAYQVQLEDATKTALPIGKPLSNTQIYILDKYQQLVAPKLAGELYIGGVGVANSYWNRPELTAERFLANPFVKGEQMYRTGDKAKWLEDGNIVFLGRLDDQVKIRGFRIELGEIEATLESLASIEQAVVTVNLDHAATKRLLAYVVAKEEINKEVIQTYLRDQLPEYMVPAMIIDLAAIPITVNGKVDKKALPVPDMADLRSQQYVAASTDLERSIVAIWKSLLNVEQIGIYDNFFELGGDSIISIQVVSRIKKEGYQILPRDLFQHQTVASLAQFIQDNAREMTILAEQGQLTGTADLLPIQHWFFEKEYTSRSHFNQDNLFEVDKTIKREHLGIVLKALVAQHDALRFKYSLQETKDTEISAWVQEYGSYEPELAYHDLRDLNGVAFAKAIPEICQQYQKQLDIEAGKLIQAVFLETPSTEERNRLFIVAHHLAVDGVSWPILIDQMKEAMTALMQGMEINLGPKSSSYRQWGTALKNHALTERIETQLSYWQSITKKYVSLPVDYQQEEEIAYLEDEDICAVSLSESLTQSLLQEVNQAYHTEINDILLSALVMSIHDWSKLENIIVGLEGHGREYISSEIDLSNTVGWFTNLYPVSFEIESATSIAELIKSTKEQLRAIPDKGMGYGLLRYLHSDASIRASLSATQWDIVFNYLGQEGNAVSTESWLTRAKEATGVFIADDFPFKKKIEINSAISGGSLSLTWMYSKKFYRRATIDKIANSFIENLTRIILHCKAKKDTTYTSSDYGLSPEIDYRVLDKFLDGEKDGSLLRDQIDSIYRLSPLQEGMLFHHLYGDEGGAYIEQMALDFSSSFDWKAFRLAWEYVLQHHSILRTAILHDRFRIPVQYVYKKVALPFEFYDYSNYSEKEVEEKWQLFLKEDIQKNFDFSQAPLMRISVVKTPQADYKMLWTFHHILIDGWSIPILIAKVLKAYEHFVNGAGMEEVASRLQDKEDQYEDYIKYIGERNKLSEKAFWESYMEGFETASLLPFAKDDLARNKGGHVQEITLAFDEEFSNRIKQYTQLHRITVNTLIQGIWGFLLSKYTGNPDTLFGVTVSGRPADLAGTEEKIGLFINAIPLRVKISKEDSIVDVLARIQKEHTLAREYQYSAINDIQKWSSITGDFFDSLLTFENYPFEEAIDGSATLGVSKVEIREQTNYLFSMAISIAQVLDIKFGYNEDLMSSSSAEMIKQHFAMVLEQLVNEGKTKFSEIELLTKEEKELVFSFHGPVVAYPKNKTAVNLFEEQVLKTPDRHAVVFEDQVLTYEVLNHRANQLAHFLRNKDVKEETIVAICMDRSIDMIVAIMGTLKAGAAYLPIDPSYPKARIHYLIKDSLVDIVLTEQTKLSLFEELDTQDSLLLLPMDKNWSTIVKEINTNPVTQLNEKHLAYVIYTSGSTGQPKGVMIEHASLVNSMLNHIDLFGITEKDRISQFVSFSFDASIPEIFMSLFTGACLVLISKETIADHDAFLDYIKKQKLTVSSLPPAYISVLEADQLSFLRVIMTGGDVANVAKTTQLARHSDIYNLYGPTESTVCVSAYKIATSDQTKLSLPIGQTMANTQIYILDQDLNLLPPYAEGELCIAGINVARGYLHQRELTAEKFVPNPFQETGKLYRTGDKAKWLSDGNIAFLGRLDHQVKIRGHRIELGELEARLESCDLVNKAVVLDKKDAHGNKFLVAYILPQGDYDKKGIETYLKEELPEYMIPAVLIALDALPLTANDKIDRKALPEPNIAELQSQAYVAPRNDLERQLVQIWEGLLQLDKIGIRDNFFELGGHSLLATRLLSALRKDLQLDIQIKDLFTHATIASLSEFVAEQDHGSQLTEITIQERPERIPLSYAQDRLWFIDKLSGSTHYHIPTVESFEGNIDKDILSLAFQEIINRHEVLRTVYLEEDGQAYQQVLAKDQWQLSYEELLDRNSVSDIVALEIEKAFDLTKDHMLRAKLLKLSENQHLLILVLHHIAADGWSSSILFEELMEVYQAKLTNRPARLKDLPIQYIDYALWQRQYLAGDVLEAKLKYWEEKLQDLTTLDLLTDFPRPAVQSLRGKHFKLDLEKALLEQLELQAKEEGVTMFMFLLAALKVLLHKYTGQTDITVGSPIANRTQAELENLIGFFVNTLTLRSDLAGASSFKDLLQRVKETTLDAYNHQDVPFEKIVGRVVAQRDMSRSPLFQVMFSYQNSVSSTVEEELGSTTDQEDTRDEAYTDDFARNTAKFDLTFDLTATNHGLELNIDYCSDLFLPETIHRMAKHFEQLILSVLENPEQTIGELNILTKEEAQQVVVDFNQTEFDYPSELSLIDLFERQVRLTPTKKAIGLEEQYLDYQSLDERANQLAHFLLEQGVEEEALIAVCFDRSIEMIIALLAILKAGAAYVPLDPAYPAQRKDYILEDTKAKFVLTMQAYVSSFAEESSLTTICLDDWSEIEKAPTTALSNKPKPNHLAYIIYTSGSTGMPKGVQVEHASVVNEICFYAKTYGVDYSDKHMLLANYVFDASVEQIFLPLTHGVQLELITKANMLNPAYLERMIVEKGITHIHCTPSLLQHITPNLSNQVKRICAGGELCSETLAKSWGDEVRFFNKYGPTETTISCSYHLYDANSSYPTGLPIGKAIGNTQLYVLDKQQKPVAIGIVGELYIGGKGITRGYLNRATLTEEKFIPSPFEEGAKLYRTGDLVRWRSNGELEFKGREDDQIKLRGYRIELGEIETVLLQHAMVQQAVVLIKEDANQQRVLVAYVVASKEKGTFEQDQLEAYLAKALPEYMLPSFIMCLEELPISPTGKVDRRALPDFEFSQKRNDDFVAPSTDIEKQLVRIWTEVLNVERIGIHDNFFELGGHSLLIIKLLAKLSQSFGVELPVAVLFEAPTIAGLSQKILSQETKQDQASMLLLNSGVARQKIFCVPGIEGSAMSFHELAKEVDSDFALYAFQAQGLEGIDAPMASVEEIAASYIKALQKVDPVGPYTLSGYSFGAKVAYEMALQLRREHYEVSSLTIVDAVALHKDEKKKLPKTEAQWMVYLGNMISRLFGQDFSLSAKTFKAKEEAVQYSILQDYLEGSGISFSINQLKGLQAVFEARLACDYLPKAETKLDVPIRLFETKLLARRKNFILFGKTNADAWRELTSERVDALVVSGDHWSILKTPHVKAIAEILLAE